MTAYTLPAADADGEEWGRLARRIPGFAWRPGMRQPAEDGGPGFARCVETVGRGAAEWHGFHGWGGYDDGYPDPDDPTGATAGCFLRLLGPWVAQVLPPRWEGDPWRILWQDPTGRQTAKGWAEGANLGRCGIAAAAAIRRWPGGS